MLINRDHDVITGKKDLQLLHRFNKFPVFMGCVDHDPSNDIFSDMAFYISPSSGMIQLNPLLPLDILYPEAHGAGCVGASWESHHREFAKFIAQYSPKNVLEIGGAHGILSIRYHEAEEIPWTILEPNPTPMVNCKARFIKGFFNRDFHIDEPIDAVVHSHVFEHIYDPLSFMQDLKKFIPIGKRLIFSVPNMRVMLEKKFTNCLNFEHTIYLSDDYIEFILAEHGFEIEEKTNFRDDHSIFYSAVRSNNSKKTAISTELYSVNRKLYLDYIDYHLSLVNRINAQTSSRGDREFFLFGAHVQSQYLIGFGLNTSNIKAVLDNDASKQGKRLYGTSLKVFSPANIASSPAPTIIIRAGTFTNEIIEQIKLINPSSEFIQ